MRQLTIHRTKCFTGCLMTAKVYLEDATRFETTISGVPCRKIGVLKNNQTATFEIPNEAVKVFVITDLMSKEFANDYYQLEAGEEPVQLTGSFRYAPHQGNPFRFDNNSNGCALENRKKTGKKGLWVMIGAVIVGVIIGLFKTGVLVPPKEQVFTEGEFSITLNDRFTPSQVEDYYICYDSSNVAVMVLCEKFEDYAGLENFSLQAYGEYMVEYYELEDTLEVREDCASLWYEGTTNAGVTYRYTDYYFKTDDAFWTVTFATEADRVETYAEKIEAWASSVSVD